jgi:hypothetical protein
MRTTRQAISSPKIGYCWTGKYVVEANIDIFISEQSPVKYLNILLAESGRNYAILSQTFNHFLGYLMDEDQDSRVWSQVLHLWT